MSNSSGKKIYLSPPHLNGDELKYIADAIESNWVAPLGPHVDAFEKEISQYTGVNHAVALSSGTAALHLALKLLGVKEGDHVFCSDLTFIASANAILYLGAIPIFIDSEELSWNMCPNSLEIAFKNHRPKAVVVTDLYGQSARYSQISSICNQQNVPIIEDAAESLGAEYNGKKCGSFGEMAVLSFNGNKIITTSGGGMLLSQNGSHIKNAKKLSSQAREDALHYEHKVVGYNYRMSNILAALGRAQLKKLNQYVEKRRKIYNYYEKRLNGNRGISFMPEIIDGRSTRWLSVIISEKSNHKIIEKVINNCSDENIEIRPIWKPMHMQPVFEGTSFYTSHKYPLSSHLFEHGLCLPSGSNLSNNDQDRIIDIIIREF